MNERAGGRPLTIVVRLDRERHYSSLIMRLHESREKQADLLLERNKLAIECLEQVNVLRKQMDAVFRGLAENARPLRREGMESGEVTVD